MWAMLYTQYNELNNECLIVDIDVQEYEPFFLLLLSKGLGNDKNLGPSHLAVAI